jgi:hypothetical protein
VNLISVDPECMPIECNDSVDATVPVLPAQAR